MPRRTALIVPVPEAEPIVSAIRAENDWSAARGIPAHVTILFPFASPEHVDEAALTDLVGRFPSFVFELDRVERWDSGTVWLHPAPTKPFADLTAAVWQRWPHFPPYEGVHDEVIPHLTVSDKPIDFSPALPIACRATEVALYEEDEATGLWWRHTSFSLARPPGSQGVA